jgi:hypothetical protein
MNQPPENEILPADAREILQQAARTPNTQREPLARTKAIEQATTRVRRMYPKFFNHKEE